MSTPRRILVASAAAFCALALVACVILFMFSPLLIALAPFDDAKRLPFRAFGSLVLSGLALALLVRGRSLRTLTASEVRVVAVAVTLALGAFGWAAFGIDSTRAVRELSEAGIVFAAATETGRITRPANGSITGREGASLERTYETSARYVDVLAFYGHELESRGWSGGGYFGVSSSDTRLYHWFRDGYTYGLDIPTGELSRSGWFRTRILGPPP
jgi:hypothetical protein